MEIEEGTISMGYLGLKNSLNVLVRLEHYSFVTKSKGEILVLSRSVSNLLPGFRGAGTLSVPGSFQRKLYMKFDC